MPAIPPYKPPFATEETRARARRVVTNCLTINNVCLHRDVAIYLVDAVAGEMETMKRELTGDQEEDNRPEGVA